jgi:steroid 5-alpha reductase family enzyme
MNAWTLIGFGANASMLIMAVAWAVARRAKNASYLDVAWLFGFAIIGCLYALIGTGDPFKKALLTSMVTIWSLRLGTSLLLDVLRNHPAERPRFVALREQFPKRPWLMFFGFSQYQAALLTLLSAPFAIVCSNPTREMNGWEIAGLLLWVLAMSGETLARVHSIRFRFTQENSSRGAHLGLWRLSRHPNLFFEWLVSVSYFFFSIGSPWGWVTFYCPILMLYCSQESSAFLSPKRNA